MVTHYGCSITSDYMELFLVYYVNAENIIAYRLNTELFLAIFYLIKGGKSKCIRWLI
jgi:hypothetical protein